MNLNLLRRTTLHWLLNVFVFASVVMSLPGHAQSVDTVLPETMSASNTDLTALGNVITTYAPSDANLAIPVLVILLVFGGPILIVTMLILQHYRAQQHQTNFRQDCINKLIDAGQDIPESLLFLEDTAKSADKDLSRGIKNVGLGLGITLFLTAVNGLAAGTFGLILVGLGGAQLISWKLTRKTA